MSNVAKNLLVVNRFKQWYRLYRFDIGIFLLIFLIVLLVVGSARLRILTPQKDFIFVEELAL